MHSKSTAAYVILTFAILCAPAAALDPIASELASFPEVVELVRAAIEAESWDALATGLEDGGTTQSIDRSAGASGKRLRQVCDELARRIEKDRKSGFATAFGDRDPAAVERAIIVVAFDIVKLAVSNNVEEQLLAHGRAIERQQAARNIFERILEPLARTRRPQLADALTANFAEIESHSVIGSPASVEPYVAPDTTRYGQLAIEILRGLEGLVAVELRQALPVNDAAAITTDSGTKHRLIDTAAAARMAASQKRFAELRAGFAGEGAMPADPEAAAAFSAGASLKEICKEIADFTKNDHNELIARALNDESLGRFTIVLAVLGYETIRIMLAENLKSEPSDLPLVRWRHQAIAQHFHELIWPTLGAATVVKQGEEFETSIARIRARIARLDGVAPPTEGAQEALDPQVYEEQVTALVTEIRGALTPLIVAAFADEKTRRHLAESAPPPAKRAPPAAAVPQESTRAMIRAVRMAVIAGAWDELFSGYADVVSIDATPSAPSPARAAGASLRRVADRLSLSTGENRTEMIKLSMKEKSIDRIDRALVLMAFDAIREASSENLKARLTPYDLAVTRNLEIASLCREVFRPILFRGAGVVGSEALAQDDHIRDLNAKLSDPDVLGTNPANLLVDPVQSNPTAYGEIAYQLLQSLSEVLTQMYRTEAAARVASGTGSERPEPEDEHGHGHDHGQGGVPDTAASDEPLIVPGRPMPYLDVVRALKDATAAGKWKEILGGFRAELPPDKKEAFIGHEIRRYSMAIDADYGQNRLAAVGAALASEDHKVLDRALIVLSYDSLRLLIRRNLESGLTPREITRARNLVAEAIYLKMLAPLVTAERDPAIRAQFAEVQSDRIAGTAASPADPLEYGRITLELLRELASVVTDAFKAIAPDLATGAARDTPARSPASALLNAEDPAAFAAIIAACKSESAAGKWYDLLRGFDGADAAEIAANSAAKAGADLRIRVAEIDDQYRVAGKRVAMTRKALQGQSLDALERLLLVIAYDTIRLNFSRNMNEGLRPSERTRKRNGIARAIYTDLIRPEVMRAVAASAAITDDVDTAFARLDAAELIGSDTATEAPAQVSQWGEAALELLRLIRPEMNAFVERAGDAAAAEVVFATNSEDPFVRWGIDGLKIATQRGLWGEVLLGMAGGGPARETDTQAMVCGRTLRNHCGLARELFGADHQPAFESAIEQRDSILLSRVLVLLSYDVIRARLNTNITAGLVPYDDTVARNQAARDIYDTTLRAVVLGEEVLETTVGRARMDQTILRAFAAIESVEVLGDPPTSKRRNKRAPDVAAYRGRTRDLLEILVLAISAPERAVEILEERRELETRIKRESEKQDARESEEQEDQEQDGDEPAEEDSKEQDPADEDPAEDDPEEPRVVMQESVQAPPPLPKEEGEDDKGAAPAAPRALAEDALDEALGLFEWRRADVGFHPRGWWSRYPADIPYKLRHFDDLMAEPLAVVTFTRTAGAVVRQSLTAEALAVTSGKHDGALYQAVHALGIERRFGGLRSYSANLLPGTEDLAQALVECHRRDGRIASGFTFGQASPYPQIDADAARATAAIPSIYHPALARLIVRTLDAHAWALRAFRRISMEEREAVSRRFDLGEEAVDALDYCPEADDVAIAWDEASMWYAGLQCVEALDQARRELSALTQADAVTAQVEFALDWRTPLGWIRIRGHGDDEIDGSDSLLIVDLGGNDQATNTAGATPTQCIALHLDLSGDDRHGGDAPAMGSGLCGVGILLDASGDDQYSGEFLSQGAGQFGLGVLADLDGYDTYRARYSSQGAGFFGVGVAIDAAGNDTYEIHSDGQGFGGSGGGVGALADHAGNDTYTAVRDPKITRRGSYHSELAISVSNAQGCAVGRRGDGADGHSWAGGLGMLLDGGGNDTYTSGNWSMGTGYWFGTGLLWDGDGDDSYEGVVWSQGSGAHFCIGALIDESGDDRHVLTESGRTGLAFGHDFTVALLIDAAGNDVYSTPGDGLGMAINRSIAMLIDVAGNDSYTGPATRSPGQAIATERHSDRKGTSTYFAEATSLGLFLDLGGADNYAPERQNDFTWLDPPESPNYQDRNYSIGRDLPTGHIDFDRTR